MSRPIQRDTGGGGRPPSLGQRIAAAIMVGAFLGLVFAILYPDEFIYSSVHSVDHVINNTAATKVTTTTCQSSQEYLNHLKSMIREAWEDNRQLKSQIWLLRDELRQVKQDNRHTQERVLWRTNPTVTPNESTNPKLAQLLKKLLGNHRELIVVLANSNAYVKDALHLWLTNVHRLGLGNYLIYALDNEMLKYCLEMNVPVYKRLDNNGLGSDFDTIAKTGSNHKVSGLKFRILRDFLQLGYSVLLSDIDTVYLQNPFLYLHRDADIEAMTDGYNNETSYGYDDVFDDKIMGWSRYAHTMRIWVYNSGFFYIRPTVPAIDLLDRVASRLAREDVWDQTVFNEELFLPAYPGYEGLHISKRTMDYYLFMNSKILFKIVRKDSKFKKALPVIVHMNYHPDKVERMKVVMDYYVYGKANALDSFPDANEMPIMP